MTAEREIAGFPGYYVRDDGTVWSSRDRRGRPTPGRTELSVYRRPYGSRYRVVCMRAVPGGRVHQKYVHRLVLETFAGPCPAGMEALHGNRDTADNRLVNLRWGTHLENVHDRIKDGTHGHKLSEADVLTAFRLKAAGTTGRAAAKILGVSDTMVYQIWRRRSWAHVPLPVG